jgi:hypothetical protein
MNKFATNEAHKPSRIGTLAVISGVMLGAVGAVGPALSADLPDDYPPYRPTYYRDYSSNYDSGYRGNYDSGCCGCCEPRPVRVERFPVMEDRPPLMEERPPFAAMERPRYGYSSYPARYRYSDDYPGPGAESYRAYEPAPYREQPAPYRERRRRLSYAGAHYPPAPAAYKYESERAPYRYAASHPPYDYYRPSYEPEYNPAYRYQPVYEHEPSPRPPAAVPRGYYGPGYSE